MRKQDRNPYNTKSLLNLVNAIQRHTIDIFQYRLKGNLLFNRFWNTLDGELKRLTELGYGETKQAKEFTRQEQYTILENVVCSMDTPRGLIHRCNFFLGL